MWGVAVYTRREQERQNLAPLRLRGTPPHTVRAQRRLSRSRGDSAAGGQGRGGGQRPRAVDCRRGSPAWELWRPRGVGPQRRGPSPRRSAASLCSSGGLRGTGMCWEEGPGRGWGVGGAAWSRGGRADLGVLLLPCRPPPHPTTRARPLLPLCPQPCSDLRVPACVDSGPLAPRKLRTMQGPPPR